MHLPFASVWEVLTHWTWLIPLSGFSFIISHGIKTLKLHIAHISIYWLHTQGYSWAQWKGRLAHGPDVGGQITTSHLNNCSSENACWHWIESCDVAKCLSVFGFFRHFVSIDKVVHMCTENIQWWKYIKAWRCCVNQSHTSMCFKSSDRCKLEIDHLFFILCTLVSLDKARIHYCMSGKPPLNFWEIFFFWCRSALQWLL